LFFSSSPLRVFGDDVGTIPAVRQQHCNQHRVPSPLGSSSHVCSPSWASQSQLHSSPPHCSAPLRAVVDLWLSPLLFTANKLPPDPSLSSSSPSPWSGLAATATATAACSTAFAVSWLRQQHSAQHSEPSPSGSAAHTLLRCTRNTDIHMYAECGDGGGKKKKEKTNEQVSRHSQQE
jgi:hypothetical protein